MACVAWLLNIGFGETAMVAAARAQKVLRFEIARTINYRLFRASSVP
jgi:hypothetical protein